MYTTHTKQLSVQLSYWKAFSILENEKCVCHVHNTNSYFVTVGAAKVPLIIYGTNLVLNWSWTPLFFNLKKVDIAFYEANVLGATAAATAYFFYKINPVAGALFVPYILWLGFAIALSYRIFKDNPEHTTRITEIKSQ